MLWFLALLLPFSALADLTPVGARPAYLDYFDRNTPADQKTGPVRLQQPGKGQPLRFAPPPGMKFPDSNQQGAGGPGGGGGGSPAPMTPPKGALPNWTPSDGRNNDPSSSGAGSYQEGPPLTGAGLYQGLCGKSNAQHGQVTRGYCKTLREALDKGCLGEIIDKVAQRPDDPVGVEKYCSNFKDIKRNPEAHKGFWTNLLAALAQEESNWNNFGPPGDGGKSHGIFQIGNEDRRYRCECSNVNVAIPTSNITCGAYIAMANMSKDYTIASGSVRNLATVRGIARYFGPFNDHQANKRSRIAQKTANWCATEGTEILKRSAAPAIASAGEPEAVK